ncbi:hypothetical protein BKA62DRAFT_658273 [Auriculariales sp. MPI-PUGE-AT-0066]|nr:hypothetical protein BKA62DRAFT_658273 [Auriculariales sp. MPI-PUGE-AT-0066]
MAQGPSLTRDQFNQACDALLVDSHNLEHEIASFRGSVGWSTVSSTLVPSLRCLERSVFVSAIANDENLMDDLLDINDGPVDEPEDVASSAPTPLGPAQLLTVKQWIVYSPSFSVPAFYFSCHDASGAPVPLDRIMRSRLFLQAISRSVRQTPHSLEMPDNEGPFPLLSQGDHPVLGVPCWYLHPCETQRAMDELLKASASGTLSVWLQTWLALISTTIDLRT